MASLPEDGFQQVEKEVFQKLNTDDNVDYKKLKSDPAAMQKVEEAMKKTYDELEYMMKNADSLDNALGHLSPERQQLVKTTFRLQSFNVDIERQTDGAFNLLFASLSGEPVSFVPSVLKIDRGNYEKNRVLLAARIIFEIVTLVLNLVGLRVSPSSKATAEAIQYITSILNAQPKIFGQLEKMIDAAEKNDMKGVATAIIWCAVDLFNAVGTPLLGIVKVILQDMSWFDRIIAVAQVLCYVAATILSAGAAVVAKVISWLLSATSFVKKLLQMNEYKGIKFAE